MASKARLTPKQRHAVRVYKKKVAQHKATPAQKRRLKRLLSIRAGKTKSKHAGPGAKPTAKPAKPYEAHLDPAQQGDYINQWNQTEEAGIAATQEYKDVISQDPVRLAQIETMYNKGIRSTSHQGAARGLTGQGVSLNMLTDVSRQHTLALDDWTTTKRLAKEKHDALILGIQKRQGFIKSGAVGMKLGNFYTDDYYAPVGPTAQPPGVPAATQPAPAPGTAPGAAPGSLPSPGAYDQTKLPGTIITKPGQPYKGLNIAGLQARDRVRAQRGKPYGPTGAPFVPGKSLGMYPGAPKKRGAIVAPGAITKADRRAAARRPKKKGRR